MKVKRLWMVILLGLLFIIGCNIFEPFHSEGKSDDVEVLLEDAKAALANNQPEKALEYLDKAMRIDPNHPAVRYYHAVAVMRVYGIELSAFFDAFKGAEESSPTPTGSLIQVFSKPKQDTLLFQLPEEELQNMLNAFSQVEWDLAPLVEGLRNNTISYADVPDPGDTYLSHGVSVIITAMLRILDNDDTEHDFSMDPRITIKNESGRYVIEIYDPYKTAAELDAELDSLISLYWDSHFEAGRQDFADYYNDIHGYPLITLPPIPAPLPEPPFPPDDSPAGGLMRIVDRGLRALYAEMMD